MTQGLLKSAGKAVAWNALANWIGLLGGFLSLVVLARLLAPVEFGLFGMALVALAIPETIACNSLNQSLIRQPDLKPGHCSSVFLMSVGLGLVFFVLMIAGAPLIAQAFGEPRLTAILQVMSVILVMGALSTVPAALLQRELRYREITHVDVAGTLVAAIAGITLAILLKDAWALVFMELLRRLVRMVGFIWLVSWRPSLRSSWQDARDLASFNLATVGLELFRVAESNIPRGVVGAVLGPASLGMFSLALRILEQVRRALVSPIGALALPVAAKSQDNLPVLHRALEGAIQLTSLLAYPVLIGGAVVAPIFVPLLFGPQWVTAIPAVQIALLIGLRSPSSAFNAGILKGVGRPVFLLNMSILGLAALVILTLLAVPHGLEAVMFALLAQQLLMWGLTGWGVAKIIGFPVSRQLLAGTGALAAALVMAAVVTGIGYVLPANWNDGLRLGLLILAGGVSYVIALAVISPQAASRIFRAARVAARGNRSAALAIFRGQDPGDPVA